MLYVSFTGHTEQAQFEQKLSGSVPLHAIIQKIKFQTKHGNQDTTNALHTTYCMHLSSLLYGDAWMQ